MACPHQNLELDDVPTKTEQTPERWRIRAVSTSGGAKPGWIDPSGCEGQNAPSPLPTGKRMSELHAPNDLLSRRQGPQGEPCQKLQRTQDTSTVSAGRPAVLRHHPLLRNGGVGDRWPALEKPRWCPLRAGRPSATTSWRRASWRSMGRSRGGPASRQTFSNGNPRIPNTPDRGLAARWRPKKSGRRPHRQVNRSKGKPQATEEQHAEELRAEANSGRRRNCREREPRHGSRP